jgi:hypothetical protein
LLLLIGLAEILLAEPYLHDHRVLRGPPLQATELDLAL